jgi:hypothetical protein
MLTQSYANAGTIYNTYNTALGYQALYATNPTSATAGSADNAHNNVAVGTNALYDNQTGYYNVAMGRDAGRLATASNYNTSIGSFAGNSYNDGHENTFLGAYADASAAGFTNATAVGARAVAGASNTLVLGSVNGVNGATSNVNVGIGTTTPAAELENAGFTKLGSNAPAIKMKKLTGACPGAEGGSTSVAHGVTSSKIIGCQVLIDYTGTGVFVPNSYNRNAEYEFDFYITTTDVVVYLSATNSGNLVSDNFVVLLTYEQ